MTPPRKTGREEGEGLTFASTRWRDLRDAEAAVADTNGEVDNLKRALEKHQDSYEGFKSELKDRLEKDQATRERKDEERQRLDRDLFERIGGLNAKVSIMLAVMSATLVAMVGGIVTLVLRR